MEGYWKQPGHTTNALCLTWPGKFLPALHTPVPVWYMPSFQTFLSCNSKFPSANQGWHWKQNTDFNQAIPESSRFQSMKNLRLLFFSTDWYPTMLPVLLETDTVRETQQRTADVEKSLSTEQKLLFPTESWVKISVIPNYSFTVTGQLQKPNILLFNSSFSYCTLVVMLCGYTLSNVINVSYHWMQRWFRPPGKEEQDCKVVQVSSFHVI